MSGKSQPEHKVILTRFRKYLIADYKRPETINSYVRRVRLFLDVIGKEPNRLTKDDILKWKSYCSKYHNNSLTPMYGAIKKFITFLADIEVIDDSLESIARRKLKAPKLKHDENNIDKLVLKPEKFKAVFDLAKKSNLLHYALFKTMFWSQARRCEILGLRISDIDFENKKITFSEEYAKGGKRATVNVAEECLDILRDYKDNIRDKPKKEEYNDILFLYEGRPISRNRIWKIHNIYSYKLGFFISCHMWRHTGITEYAKVEKDVKIVQRQARHEDVNITMNYINYAKGTYAKSYHEKFAKGIVEQKPEPNIPSKPNKPKPQDNYIANPQVDSKDTMILELQKEIERLKSQLDESNRGYQ